MNDGKTSNVYKGDVARGLLANGVNEVADAVKTTLGAAGRNAALQEQAYPGHIVTNDGVSIALKVRMDHPAEEMGANIMKEVADRANKESGDGTTTSMVLAQAILAEGLAAGVHSMEVKRSLDEALAAAEAAIDSQKRTVTVDEVAQAATVSAEDPALGAMIQEIFQKIGKDGIVEIDTSGTFDDSYEVKDGFRIRNAGYMAPYMANQGAAAVYERPAVLVARQRISVLSDIDPLFRELSQRGKSELVMFVDEIDGSVLNALAYTHVKGIFKTLIVRAPKLWKDWYLEDLAKVTGATVIDADQGVSWKNAGFQHLGSCERFVAARDESIAVGGLDVSEWAREVESRGSDEDRLRASWLNTKAAVLKVGGRSETELSYRRLKAEDARSAAWLALQDGVVPGGGVALFNAATAVRAWAIERHKLEVPLGGGESRSSDHVGARILYRALKAPLRQICENAGVKLDHVMQDEDWDSPPTGVATYPDLGGSKGFDAVSLKIVDMWEAGIVDPAKVVKNALRNAVSVAGTVLTTETVVVLPKA